MRECLFHFKLIKGGVAKEYRTVVMIPDNKQPDISDFIQSFAQSGYKVELENERELIFHSVDAGNPYKLDITKIEIKGEKQDTPYHDGELHALINTLIKRNW